MTRRTSIEMGMTGHILEPLEKGNLSERVYAKIRDGLMEGRFEPGERLRISALAGELQVSITPVREAIFRLVSDHALVMTAATAIHVPELSAEQVREIQTIRILLEGAAVAVAASKVTPSQLVKLEGIHAQFQDAARNDPPQAAYFNRLFHFELLAIANMPMITATVENMWVLTGPLLRTFHTSMPTRDLMSSDHKHFEVLEGLRTGNGQLAQSALQEDIRWGLVLADWIEERAAAAAPVQ